MTMKAECNAFCLAFLRCVCYTVCNQNGEVQ